MNKSLLFAALLLLAGCAGQTTIALLPEDGGRVGKVYEPDIYAIRAVSRAVRTTSVQRKTEREGVTAPPTNAHDASLQGS